MPFKHSNIEYGLPHEEYPKTRIQECVQSLRDTLELKSEPVGIQFIFTEEEYNHYPVAEIKSAMPYCVMVKQGFGGKAVKSALKHHKCDGATTALALEPSTEQIENGKEYFSYRLYSSVAVARRMRASIKSMHRTEAAAYGVAIVPLKDCVQAPDVVIIMTNAMQTMRFVQGYEYRTGKKPQLDLGAMQGMCSELTAVPYLTGEMNISVLCPSTRMLCKWGPNDMAVGIPFELLEQITEGVMATIPNY